MPIPTKLNGESKNDINRQRQTKIRPFLKTSGLRRFLTTNLISNFKDKLDTSASLSLTSLCTHSTDMSNQSKLSVSSPVSTKPQQINSDIILNNLIDENNNNIPSGNNLFGLNQCAAKKLRLVKRLKNRIETKSGQKLQFSVPKLNSTSSLNFKIKNTIENNGSTSPYTLRNISIAKGNSLLSSVSPSPEKETTKYELPRIQLLSGHGNHERVGHVYENNCQYLLDNKVHSHNTNRSFVIDTSIEPVYF